MTSCCDRDLKLNEKLSDPKHSRAHTTAEAASSTSVLFTHKSQASSTLLDVYL